MSSSIAKNISTSRVIEAVEQLTKSRDEELVDDFVNDSGTWAVIRRNNNERLVFARVDCIDMGDSFPPLVHDQFKMAAMQWLVDNDQDGNIQVSFDHLIMYVLNEHRAFIQWTQNVDFSKED